MKEYLGRLVCGYHRIAKLLLSMDFFSILMDSKISETPTSRSWKKISKDMALFSLEQNKTKQKQNPDSPAR